MMSSVNTASVRTSSLLRCEGTGIPYYHITFSCPEDKEKTLETKYAIACHHYILAPPPHVSNDSTQKAVMNAIEENSFGNEMLGVLDGDKTAKTLTGEEHIDPSCIFSAKHIIGMKQGTNTVDVVWHITQNTMDTTLYMYIDPAYTISKKNSATGMAILSAYTEKSSYPSAKAKSKALILAVEQYWLTDHAESAGLAIGAKAAGLLLQTLITYSDKTTSTPYFEEVIIGIEYNSSENAAQQIAKTISRLFKAMSSPIVPKFFHKNMDKSYMEARGTTDKACFGTQEVVGFWLDKKKINYCESFRNDFNKGYILCSMVPISSINQSYKLVATQFEKFHPTRKPDDGSQNDVAIAIIMAYILMLNRNNEQWRNRIHPLHTQ